MDTLKMTTAAVDDLTVSIEYDGDKFEGARPLRYVTAMFNFRQAGTEREILYHLPYRPEVGRIMVDRVKAMHVWDDNLVAVEYRKDGMATLTSRQFLDLFGFKSVAGFIEFIEPRVSTADTASRDRRFWLPRIGSVRGGRPNTNTGLSGIFA